MYAIYVWEGDTCCKRGEFTNILKADERAKELSLQAGVSEALVYDGHDTLITVFVNGEEVDIVTYLGQFDEDDYYDDVDECGYNPYMGCNDYDC